MKSIIYTMDRQKIDDKKGLHSDMLDACLYAFRYIYMYLKPKKEVKDVRTWEDKRFQAILEANRKKPSKFVL